MNNEKPCCGIDVSQNTLDVAYQNNLGEIFHIKVANNNKGFQTIWEHSSGTSIQARPTICKTGGKPIRDVLYMCAINAIRTNTACKALYERLRAKGKSGKLAL